MGCRASPQLRCIAFFLMNERFTSLSFFFTPEVLKTETTHALVPCFTQRTLNCVAPLTVSDTDSDIPVSRALIHNHGTREEGSRAVGRMRRSSLGDRLIASWGQISSLWICSLRGPEATYKLRSVVSGQEMSGFSPPPMMPASLSDWRCI
jgi:hypothetical protein